MKAIILASLAGIFWGVGEIFTKSVLHTGKVGPITALAVRSSVALPVMLLTWWYVTSRSLEPANWTEAGAGTLSKLVLGSGLIAGAGGMIFFYLALHAGDISRVKPIAFTLAPTTAVLLGWLVLGEPMSAQKAVGIGLVIAGVLVLTAGR